MKTFSGPSLVLICTRLLLSWSLFCVPKGCLPHSGSSVYQSYPHQHRRSHSTNLQTTAFGFVACLTNMDAIPHQFRSLFKHISMTALPMITSFPLIAVPLTPSIYRILVNTSISLFYTSFRVHYLSMFHAKYWFNWNRIY